MRDRAAIYTASVLLTAMAACSTGPSPPPSPSTARTSPPPSPSVVGTSPQPRSVVGTSPQPRSVISTSPQPSTDDAPETGPPPLNRLERTIIDALADLGIKAQRAQLPAEKSASIWAEAGGTHLSVSAHRSGIRSHATVTGTRRIANVVVRRVRYETGSTPDQFTCAGFDYQVDGHPPPGFATADAFLSGLLAELRCS
ncbi:hypothetical protein AB0I81_09520 [Nonomuraea sp. NPDC050404]|uniref:hypothetical protein n=1 Tax=Nonomuraea sp. NPDC050404 TaxID=3155783 RepID=UPI0033CB8997